VIKSSPIRRTGMDEDIITMTRRYLDFAPLHATEKLWERHKVRVSREKVRRIMVAQGRSRQRVSHTTKIVNSLSLPRFGLSCLWSFATDVQRPSVLPSRRLCHSREARSMKPGVLVFGNACSILSNFSNLHRFLFITLSHFRPKNRPIFPFSYKSGHYYKLFKLNSLSIAINT